MDGHGWRILPVDLSTEYTLLPGEDADTTSADRAHAHLLRDIFGNPFRPVTVDPTWLTPAVHDLAKTIYNDRTFDRMPELADALEAAGCFAPEALGHCRGGGDHVRGCWVVDGVLGKR